MAEVHVVFLPSYVEALKEPTERLCATAKKVYSKARSVVVGLVRLRY